VIDALAVDEAEDQARTPFGEDRPDLAELISDSVVLVAALMTSLTASPLLLAVLVGLVGQDRRAGDGRHWRPRPASRRDW
jgi:hypothetical protein